MPAFHWPSSPFWHVSFIFFRLSFEFLPVSKPSDNFPLISAWPWLLTFTATFCWSLLIGCGSCIIVFSHCLQYWKPLQNSCLHSHPERRYVHFACWVIFHGFSLSADYLCKQFGPWSQMWPNISLGLIWIQTIWHSSGIPDRMFLKSDFTTTKNQSRTNGPINAHLTIAQV